MGIENKDRSKLLVCNQQCNQCLYSKNKIVSDDRRREIFKRLKNTGDYFICHKASIVGEDVMCAGYYEAHRESSLLIRLGILLNRIFFIDVIQLMKSKKWKNK